MAYLPEERETIIRYDELENSWYLESNVRKHITKILKTEEVFESVDKELENGRVVSVRAKLSNLDDYLISPFVRKRVKRELTDEQREQLREARKLSRRK
ncbi:hypothetical protein [Streptococcus gallolyticus]|uniref:hypothetical protein n=1 Tax=Streptococcus gallolyticus TaxID=315405 RepID=UPI0022843574|nr:hypothetical protein [Streptococcus gallolyticus]MCY7156708.1 hypothetical protein [Streptococcus gallolyticus subsp. gallolyticus]